MQDPRVEATEIYILDGQRGELIHAFHRGLSEECVAEARATPIRLGEGIIGNVASTGEAVFVADLSRNGGLHRECLKKEEYASLFSCPIKSADRVWGLWNLFFKSERLPSRYLNWLAASAELLAIAFECSQALAEGNARLELLKESEKKYRELVEDINDGYLVVRGNRILFANRRVGEYLGMPVGKIIGRSFLEYMTPESLDKSRQIYERTKQGEKPPEVAEFEFQRADGTRVSVEARFKEIAYEGKRAYSVLLRDITERRRAEEALRESEEKFRLAFENAKDAILWADAETGLIINCNKAAEILLERKREEIIGHHQSTVHPPQKAEYYTQLFKHHIEQGGAADDEAEVITKSGRTKPVHITASVTLVGGKPIIQGIFRDVTERKQVEQRLQESREMLRGMIESAAAGIYMVQEGKFRYVSPLFEEISGYTKDELIGTYSLAYIHPEDREATRKRAIENLKGQSNLPHEFRFMKKDGKPIWILEKVASIQYKGQRAAVGSFMDITERKRLQDMFLQSQKMEGIGRLAGGIAHDFNNLLLAITGYASFARDALSPGNPARRDIDKVLEAANRAATLTQRLLAFSRRQILNPQVINLNNLIHSLDEMLRRLIGEDIHLVIVPAPNLGAVQVDPSQIEQVIVNLAVNARDAMPDGGRLTIETANVTLDEKYPGQHLVPTPGHFVMLSISDTGIGMTKEVKEHLFEPFFTTKEVGKGTGLGLATVYGIVKQHQGHINVYSEPGQGTTVKVYLPRVDGRAESPGVEEEDHTPCGSETVLVVEDDSAVRRLLVRVLRELGYTVLEATHGGEALEVADEHAGNIHLLLTDVVMPEMNGKALADRLSARHPDLRVLYISGYTDNSIAERHIVDHSADFLEKPFTVATLARKVRQVLDKS